MTAHGEGSTANGFLSAARRYAQENGAGLVGSAVVHGLALILFLLVLSERVSHTNNAPARSCLSIWFSLARRRSLRRRR